MACTISLISSSAISIDYPQHNDNESVGSKISRLIVVGNGDVEVDEEFTILRTKHLDGLSDVVNSFDQWSVKPNIDKLIFENISCQQLNDPDQNIVADIINKLKIKTVEFRNIGYVSEFYNCVYSCKSIREIIIYRCIRNSGPAYLKLYLESNTTILNIIWTPRLPDNYSGPIVNIPTINYAVTDRSIRNNNFNFIYRIALASELWSSIDDSPLYSLIARNRGYESACLAALQLIIIKRYRNFYNYADPNHITYNNFISKLDANLVLIIAKEVYATKADKEWLHLI